MDIQTQCHTMPPGQTLKSPLFQPNFAEELKQQNPFINVERFIHPELDMSNLVKVLDHLGVRTKPGGVESLVGTVEGFVPC